MEKVTPYSKFVGYSTETIWQIKIKGPFEEIIDIDYKIPLFHLKLKICHFLYVNTLFCKRNLKIIALKFNNSCLSPI